MLLFISSDELAVTQLHSSDRARVRGLLMLLADSFLHLHFCLPIIKRWIVMMIKQHSVQEKHRMCVVYYFTRRAITYFQIQDVHNNGNDNIQHLITILTLRQ